MSCVSEELRCFSDNNYFVGYVSEVHIIELRTSSWMELKPLNHRPLSGVVIARSNGLPCAHKVGVEQKRQMEQGGVGV